MFPITPRQNQCPMHSIFIKNLCIPVVYICFERTIENAPYELCKATFPYSRTVIAAVLGSKIKSDSERAEKRAFKRKLLYFVSYLWLSF